MSDTPTREFCQRCQSISAVGFHSPIWKEVAGRHWCNSILCIVCFAIVGDEKGIAWEVGIEFYPVSYVTLQAHRNEGTPELPDDTLVIEPGHETEVALAILKDAGVLRPFVSGDRQVWQTRWEWSDEYMKQKTTT